MNRPLPNPSTTEEEPGWDPRIRFVVTRLPWILIFLGCVLRLGLYLDNRSFSSAEAMLPLHVIDKPLGDIMDPLVRREATGAIGFILIEQVVVRAIGGSEYALRLVPLLAGILSVFLFYVLARRCLDPPALVISVALFAFSFRLILYSTVAKQYSLEVAISILVWLVILDSLSGGLSWGRAALLGGIGGVSIWLSNSVPLVLAGAGTVLGVWYAMQKRWTSLGRLALVCILWLASWYLYYVVWIRLRVHDPFLVDYWRDAGSFLPADLLSIDGVKWLGLAFVETMRDPLGFRLEPVAGVALLAGCAAAYAGRSWKLLILGAPILVTLLACGFEKYPFSGRVLQFLAPAMILLIARGAGWVWEWAPRWVGILFVALLCVPLALSATDKSLIRPKVRADVRSLMEYLEEQCREGDVVYVYGPARYGFRYYEKTHDLAAMEVVIGGHPEGNREEFLAAEMKPLEGRKRVWIFLAHAQRHEGVTDEARLVKHLDRMGERLDSLRRKRTWLYLYDLS